MVLLIMVAGLSISYVIRSGFTRVEMENLKRDMIRLEHAVGHELEMLDIEARNRAYWDPTYIFMEDLNAHYEEANLNPAHLTARNLDMVYFFDLEKQPVFRYISDNVSGTIKNQIEYELLNSPLLIFDLQATPEGHSGILSYDDLMMMVASRPIMNNDGTAPPRGHLLVGRLFGDTQRDRIAQGTELDIEFLPRNSYQEIHSTLSTHQKNGKSPFFTHRLVGDTIFEGYLPIPRLSGSTAFWIRVRESREFFQIGRDIIASLLFMLSVAALVFPSFYFLILDRKVLRRLLRLNHEVLNIGETKGQKLVTIEGRDEIASLADSINRMLANLRSSQEALKESERMNQTLAYAVLQSHLATVLLDRQFRVSQANEALLTLIDQPLENFKGREISLFCPGLSMEELNSICLDDIDDPWAGELEMHTPEGKTLWTELSLSPILDSCQSTAYYLGIIKDITQLKGREAKARFEANHDYLTGLPNRLAFRGELKKLREQPPTEEGTYALLYTDLDGFKPVNDEYSHSEGDRVLKMMAQRFTKVIRDSDRLARVGGDEFCFLIHTETDQKDALIIANRLLETMNQPFQTETATHKLGISIGVAFYPQDTRDPEELYDLADQAMYVAKKQGKNRFALHNPDTL